MVFRPSHQVRLTSRLLTAFVIVVAWACAASPPAPPTTFAAPTAASTPAGLPAGPASVTDCGSFDAGHNTYDPTGLECFWRAYTAGTSARWAVRQLTIEGDPIPSTITFDPTKGIVVTRDVTRDRFSSPADRRVWTWHCATVTRRPWATDASRDFLAVAACAGEGTETAFP